jgi:hypothetical protein
VADRPSVLFTNIPPGPVVACTRLMAAGDFFSYPCPFQIFQVAIPIYFIYSCQVASSSASMRKCRVAPAIFEKSQGKIWSYQKCDKKVNLHQTAVPRPGTYIPCTITGFTGILLSLFFVLTQYYLTNQWIIPPVYQQIGGV